MQLFQIAPIMCFPFKELTFLSSILSLHCRHNLTLVSNICKAGLRSLFCTPNRLNELPEGHLEFPFILISKLTVALSAGQSCCIL